MQRIDDSENNGGQEWSDYPKLGYNADAYVFTFNMFGFGAANGNVQVLTVDKSTVLDQNGATLKYYQNDRSGFDFTLAGATSHAALPGDPLWFVEENGGSGTSLRLVKMTNELSTSPTFTDYVVTVPSYSGAFAV